MNEERDTTPAINWGSGGGQAPSGGASQPDPPPAATPPPQTAGSPQAESTEVLKPVSPALAESAAEPRPTLQVRGRVGEDDRLPLKFGIVGGKGVGKSYLLQSLVYRSYGEQAGALTPYLDKRKILLSSGTVRDAAQHTPENLVAFVRNYETWQRLGQTLYNERWYRYQLPLRTGIVGLTRFEIEVEFFDGSGESFFGVPRSRNHGTWRDAYLDVQVMVFCLPLWVAFPKKDLSDKDLEEREQRLEAFAQAVGNYQELRELHRQERPVRSILALTMADDPRSSLTTLRDRWVEPYMRTPGRYLRKLRTQAGVMRYLHNARQVSDWLAESFAGARQVVSSIPKQLNFNGGPPWILPMSAIEGKVLDQFEKDETSLVERQRYGYPVPVHVELPLLMALCEHHNALL
jgi:GTPase SAR1 family protein